MLAKLRDLDLPGLLRAVWMIRSGVDLQLPIHGISHLGFRQHAADGFLDEANRLPLAHDAGPFLAEAALESAVPPVQLLIFLTPGQLDRGGVDHDDMIPGIDERGVNRLVLALQQPGREGRHPPEHLALGVDDMPPAVRALRARHKRTHERGNPSRVGPDRGTSRSVQKKTYNRKPQFYGRLWPLSSYRQCPAHRPATPTPRFGICIVFAPASDKQTRQVF